MRLSQDRLDRPEWRLEGVGVAGRAAGTRARTGVALELRDRLDVHG
jgi:hypothetical protein